jgi:hypothetical protein
MSMSLTGADAAGTIEPGFVGSWTRGFTWPQTV